MQVHLTSQSSAMNQEAYLLFYERCKVIVTYIDIILYRKTSYQFKQQCTTSVPKKDTLAKFLCIEEQEKQLCVALRTTTKADVSYDKDVETIIRQLEQAHPCTNTVQPIARKDRSNEGRCMHELCIL